MRRLICVFVVNRAKKSPQSLACVSLFSAMRTYQVPRNQIFVADFLSCYWKNPPTVERVSDLSGIPRSILLYTENINQVEDGPKIVKLLKVNRI